MDKLQAWYDEKNSQLDAWRPARCYKFLIERFTTPLFIGESFLDIGCGHGRLLKIAADGMCVTTGIDFSEEACQISRKNSPGSKVINMSMEELGTIKERFGYISCVGALEHSKDIAKSLLNIVSRGKSYAEYLFVVPNSLFLFAGTEQEQETLLTLDQWTRVFKGAGLKVLNVTKDPLYEKYTGFKKFLAMTFLKLLPLKCTYQFIFVLKKGA